MPKTKLEKEFQADDDGTVVVPKDVIATVPEHILKKSVKRPMTDAQKTNMERMIASNKERWAKVREAKTMAEEESKKTRKAEDQAKLDAGTHVRVAVKPIAKRVVKQVEVEEVEPLSKAKSLTSQREVEPEVVEEIVYVKKPKEKAVPKPVIKKKVIYQEETDTPTETDDDYDEYKQEKRQERREVKKNLRAIERIDNVIQQSIQNPYMAMFQSRWK